MPRRRREPDKPPPPPPALHVIRPNAVYFADTARRALRMTRETMAAEIAAGRLRVKLCAKRYYIRGQWILDWLESLPPAGRDQAPADPSLSPSLRHAQAAASRLAAEELEAFRAWLAGRKGEGG